MRESLEFFLALLDRGESACVSREDFSGRHGSALRLWQSLGFVSREPWAHHAPTCPHCAEGVPYRLGELYRCNRCRSVVDHSWLLLWHFDERAFFEWLAAELGLQGGVRRLDSRLWQLGTYRRAGELLECFYQRGGLLAEPAVSRLAAYRNVLLLYGLASPHPDERLGCQRVSLLELLGPDGPPNVADLTLLLRGRGHVRFDTRSGALWVGGRCLGEVPVGSREFYFLDCLARQRDRFVPYADLKYYVLEQTGGSDETDEATFCQGLKSRIKKKWIAEIDRFLVTTNKADGYRLRVHLEA